MVDPYVLNLWVKTVFDCPQPDAELVEFRYRDMKWDAAPEETVLCIGWTFENAGRILADFSDYQVASGLEYILNGPIFDLRNEDVAWEIKAAAFDSIFDLFEQCFARRLPPGTGKEFDFDDELSATCAIWWGEFPMHGLAIPVPQKPDAQLIDAKILEVIQRILYINADCCRSSALYGCDEWSGYYPGKVGSILQDFLLRQPVVHPELRDDASAIHRDCLRMERANTP